MRLQARESGPRQFRRTEVRSARSPKAWTPKAWSPKAEADSSASERAQRATILWAIGRHFGRPLRKVIRSEIRMLPP
jgi:hypothetical protein